MEKALTESGHIEGCAEGHAQPAKEQNATHVDIFCEGCHDWFEEPYVLPNGTDVAWPANWSRERADGWRASHGLTRPGDIPAAGPHDKPELTNDTNTAGTGMLPASGAADDQDMAPGG